MNEILIHHTVGNKSYYYTEKMKSEGLVLVTSNYDNDEGEFCTTLDLISVKKDSAIVHTLYNGSFKQIIEVYMMVKLIVEQYGTDKFDNFISDVSGGSMSSSAQGSKESQKEIYEWLRESFDEFLEEIKGVYND